MNRPGELWVLHKRWHIKYYVMNLYGLNLVHFYTEIKALFEETE